MQFRCADATTIHAINSVIVKSSKLTKVCKVYRGVANGMLPERFRTPNEFGVRGGIEPAFLSASKEREVAKFYAGGAGKPGILFEIQMGMIDRGADLQWLSQCARVASYRATAALANSPHLSSHRPSRE